MAEGEPSSTLTKEEKWAINLAVQKIGEQLFPKNPAIAERVLKEEPKPSPRDYLPLAIVRIKKGQSQEAPIEACLLDPSSLGGIEKASGGSLSEVLSALSESPKIIEGVHISSDSEVTPKEIEIALGTITEETLLSPGTQFWLVEPPSWRRTSAEKRREKGHRKELEGLLKEAGFVYVGSARHDRRCYFTCSLTKRKKKEEPKPPVPVQPELILEETVS